MAENHKDVTPIAVAIILVATLLNTFMVFRLTNKVNALARPAPAAAAAPAAAPTIPARTVDVSLDDDAVLGDPDAPVTIVEFTDYECPFCGRHFTQTHHQLVEQYIETGKAKLIVRDYPLDFHPEAQKAGEAAECAGEQGAYWAMHDQLFANQATLSVDNYKAWAGDLGLDQAAFDQCLDSGAMAAEVANDQADGVSYGVTGTPIFFINGRMVTGAQPFVVFEAVIEEALAD